MMINIKITAFINKISLNKEWVHGILGGLTASFIALLLWNFNFLDIWEKKTWDWRESQMASPSPATDDIRLILVDQKSLDWMHQTNGLTWPWPREIYSLIVNFCKRNQAKSLGFDILFTEPSTYGVQDDKIFGKAVSDYGKVASSIFIKKISKKDNKQSENSAVNPISVKGIESWVNKSWLNSSVDDVANVSIYKKAVMPIPELIQSSAILCNVQQEPDLDAIYRRLQIISIFDNYAVPTLGLGVYFAGEYKNKKPLYLNNINTINRHLSNADSNLDNKNNDIFATSDKLMIGKRVIPLDKNGKVILRYRGVSGTHKIYSAAAIIKSEIDFRNNTNSSTTSNDSSKDDISNSFDGSLNYSSNGISGFKDKYVLFGLSAPGLFDLRSSPVDSVYPGVEIQATLLDNFLNQDFIHDASKYVVILSVISLSLFCSLLITFIKSFIPLFFTVALSILFPLIFSFLSYKQGVWLPLVVQQIASLLAILFSLVLNYIREGRQKRFIKNAFSQYLSPVFIEQLIKHPEKLKLGGERKELTIFFSDLQGFTSISEKLSPEALTSLLNNYLSAMTDIIHQEGGTVDKYEGDAIIAFWNAPLDVPDHRNCAIRAALRCQKKLAQMSPEMEKIAKTEIRMRIGLNSGVVVVGNMGSHSRFDYTMLGDAVNLAARLEGANKEFGTYTMVSSFTLQGLDKIEKHNKIVFRELARLAVVGKKEAVTVFEPMFIEDFEAQHQIFEIYDKALHLFYIGDWQDAFELFSSISDKDAAASAYKKKCRELLENSKILLTSNNYNNSNSNRNGKGKIWDGVWRMTKK